MREKGGGVGSERVEVGQVNDKGDVVCGVRDTGEGVRDEGGKVSDVEG